jgi:hypothetical protein
MRRTFAVLLIVVAAPAALAGTATAASGTVPRPANKNWALVANSGASTQALTCPASNLCVWPVTDGSRNRCTWLNRDNDWWNAPVVCSWSPSQPVKAIFNNGTNSSFDGVCLYRGANFDPNTFEVFVPQGFTATNPTGAILRSHKWVRPTEPC